MKRSAGLLILGICSMPVLAHTPVIDCKAASGAVEKLICSDPSLSALDQKMAQIYQAAVAKGTDPAWLKATQRGWIKGRNECWKSSDLAACTRHNYQLRIAELQVKYQLSQPLAPIEYRCHGRPDPVTVTFYNETKPKAANITLDSSSEANSTYSNSTQSNSTHSNSTHSNSQVVSFIQPSGSGFRYGGVNTQYDVLLWGKGNDATLTINGTEYACQVIARPKDSSKTDEPTVTEKTPQDNSKSDSRVASKVDSKVPKAEQPAGQ
ncbi:MAG: MliC family protein [Plesiomonas sp.]